MLDHNDSDGWLKLQISGNTGICIAGYWEMIPQRWALFGAM
jgi:hypothetical protein